MRDYIKVSRSMLDWEWYSDINTSRLFIHMLLKANWKDRNFKGTTVPRGSFVSSIRKLADETRLTEREVRTAINHLKTTGEVTHKSTSKYSVFTVVNYDLYQSNDTQSVSQTTSERQSNDIQTTTIEERKKERRKENNNTVRFTPPDVNMVRDYCIERNNSVDPQSFVDFYTAKGWMVGKNKMKDWKAAVRTWERNHTGSKAKKNGFNNFSGRDYDMENLERQLIE
ncbi:hypothetical protein [Faecalicatena contorta]|uniref:hypothetical protein n=1 Tax=Faecalicatena contorta TaxID=39482 RepID=UPI001F409B02|nr:hypothetical protein [Faecalicatena contorta]